MAIANIISDGVGFSPGSVKFIPTRGFLPGTGPTPTPKNVNLLGDPNTFSLLGEPNTGQVPGQPNTFAILGD